jgi:predicted CXXCH cytochrome family protein
MRLYTLARWSLLVGVLIPAAACAKKDPSPQPISFSHRVHVAKKIPCTFCHTGAEKYRMATIPSVTLCMSCHSVVKTSSPEIQKVKLYLKQGTEIPWRRMYQLPAEADVFFNHHRHAAAGVKCVSCHGDVGSKDALTVEVKHNMGFCVQCHREHRAQFRSAALSDDCATCHR